jgi:hypothetical protein
VLESREQAYERFKEIFIGLQSGVLASASRCASARCAAFVKLLVSVGDGERLFPSILRSAADLGQAIRLRRLREL